MIAGEQLTAFERAVLEAFLVGEDPRLLVLRAQAQVCTVAGRRHTRVGSFTDIVVPGTAPRVSPPAMTMGDLDVRVAGLPRGATAMLFVRHGALTLLEFVTNGGDWPQAPAISGIGYFRYQPTSTGAYVLVPAGTRDSDTLALQLAGHKSSRS